MSGEQILTEIKNIIVKNADNDNDLLHFDGVDLDNMIDEIGELLRSNGLISL